jgi:predicted membrane-bound spermidine synthase
VTTYQRPNSWWRVAATVGLAAVASLFGLVTIPVYGEALVAP